MKTISFWTYTKMHNGKVKERELFGFFHRMFGLIQPGCYALIVNITNFRNNSEQMYTGLFLICQNTTHIQTLSKAVSK